MKTRGGRGVYDSDAKILCVARDVFFSPDVVDGIVRTPTLGVHAYSGITSIVNKPATRIYKGALLFSLSVISTPSPGKAFPPPRRGSAVSVGRPIKWENFIDLLT